MPCINSFNNLLLIYLLRNSNISTLLRINQWQLNAVQQHSILNSSPIYSLCTIIIYMYIVKNSKPKCNYQVLRLHKQNQFCKCPKYSVFVVCSKQFKILMYLHYLKYWLPFRFASKTQNYLVKILIFNPKLKLT